MTIWAGNAKLIADSAASRESAAINANITDTGIAAITAAETTREIAGRERIIDSRIRQSKSDRVRQTGITVNAYSALAVS